MRSFVSTVRRTFSNLTVTGDKTNVNIANIIVDCDIDNTGSPYVFGPSGFEDRIIWIKT